VMGSIPRTDRGQDRGDSDVAHLRMQQAVHQPAVDHSSSADAGADGQVNECVEAAGRAPPMFSEGGSVDVGVGRRSVERGGSSHGGDQVEIPPRKVSESS